MIVRGPLMIRGALIFRRVTDDDDFECHWGPDSHRGPVFLAGPDGQRSPVCPDVLFWVVPKPQRGAPSPLPPWLRP